MKPVIICEKRQHIASFVKQTLHLVGHKNIDIINDLEVLSNKQNCCSFFIDIEYAYIAKRILNELFKEGFNPSVSFYQVENDQVIGFWNEGVLMNQSNETSNDIFIRCKGRLERINKQDILFIESDKKYCTVNTMNKKYILRTALKHLSEQLNPVDFIRIHRSYLINKTHIRLIDTQNQNIVIENKEIPIGRFYQNNLFQQIKILQ